MMQVLIADDVRENRELAAAYLEALDCEVAMVGDGNAALAAVNKHPPDLALLDVMMPGRDGISVCHAIKSNPLTQFVPVVLLTALADSESRVLAYKAGADDYLTKPVAASEMVARCAALLRMKSLLDRLDDAQRVIVALAQAVEAKDMRTESHTERVAQWSQRLAIAAGMSSVDVDAVYLGSLIHDVGKIGVPDHILLKRGRLDRHEQAIIRQHVITGETILRSLRSVAHLIPIVRSHHERIDGAGYPDGLGGEEIPLAARIVAVSDAYDAMVSDRPYRAGLSKPEAKARLLAGSGTQWDARLVPLFLEMQ